MTGYYVDWKSECKKVERERDEARALARRYYRQARQSGECAQAYIKLYLREIDAHTKRVGESMVRVTLEVDNELSRRLEATAAERDVARKWARRWKTSAKWAHEWKPSIDIEVYTCPSCGHDYILGYNGVDDGCDSCLGICRDTKGYAWKPGENSKELLDIATDEIIVVTREQRFAANPSDASDAQRGQDCEEEE